MTTTESQIEQTAIDLLCEQGWEYIHGPELAPEGERAARETFSDVLLKSHLENAIQRLNPDIPHTAQHHALQAVQNLVSQSVVDNNDTFHRLLTEGVKVHYKKGNEEVGDLVKLVDFNVPENNEFIVSNQVTITTINGHHKRPDIILYVNGLPLVNIELKNADDEQATIKKAFDQIQTYKQEIPQLYFYNSLLVASDGYDAITGSLTAGWSRFLPWKSVDGKKEEKKTVPQLETLIKGMLRPDVMLDLIKHFSVFEKNKKEDPETGQISIETIKKIAAYHQYYAVNKAVKSTEIATSKKGNGKAGVVWHTQGSGKSLSMVFFAGKVVLRLDNPTLVILTDRNDLDDQLFDTFANCTHLLRQEPVQAKSRDDLKDLLKTVGGGIVFTTIQKFAPEDGNETFDMLSDRKNIVVIADEAHRSQYGFKAKTTVKNGEAMVKYGFAKYLRDALPNASFIGFTGTPIERDDASTPAVFGNYIDIYDIAQAVEDKATVPIYYESRLAQIHLKEDEQEKLDEEVESITENSESTASEKAKAKWTQLEAIVGHPERLKIVAKDIVDHFEKRQEVSEGKAMIVTMSRRIAVDLYEQIVNLRPEWHNQELKKGTIKVVMTSDSTDPAHWQKHSTTKLERKMLGNRLRDPDDPLKLVIVRDMWLTGFDAPCLNTLYVDKPMRGHNLMQAIARVNRVYKDKPGGLVADYIGIATDLRYALKTYTDSGGKGTPTFDQDQAVALMIEKYEIVSQFFDGFDFKQFFKADTRHKLLIILEAQEYILEQENGKSRFVKEVDLLSKAFSLSVPHLKALELKEDIGFFQAVKTRLVKFEVSGNGKSSVEMETAIRQIVDKAVVADGIVDIFDAAGIKKPDISILSDDFLLEVKGMKRKNLALELLKKILNDEIKSRSKRNMTQSRKFSEMLQNAIQRYQNNLLTSTQILDEFIKLAKDMREADQRGEKMGLSFDEVAFYDALAENDSAKKVLGDDQLRDLSRVLVAKVKANTSIDWTIKENVQAKLRTLIKRVLRKYGYPPDKQKIATEKVLEQAEMFAEEWGE